jgi:hypothetical protein
MSESLAAFRPNRSKDLKQLAEEHIQHEYDRLNRLEFMHVLTCFSLSQQDRDLLKSAGGKVSMHAGIASLAGLGLGVYFAFRLRAMRLAYFNAFRAMEKPVEVRFADGRTGMWSICTRTWNHVSLTQTFAEPIPDISDKLSPSRWGDAATYILFSVGGLFLGGEIGLLTGTASASRTITKDPESRERIEKAFKNYRIDVLKREIQHLQGKSRFEEFFSSSS